MKVCVCVGGGNSVCVFVCLGEGVCESSVRVRVRECV